MAVRNVLEEDFKEKFWITEVVKDFEWSQKKVFIIEIWEKLQILKVFKNYQKRDIRELKIYETYKDNKFLPKIISVNEYNWDIIVFEELIDWKTLNECRQDYLWNSDLIIELLKNIISVLDELWLDKITHRDIKPDNIIISWWKPYIIDFWVAKNFNNSTITETGFQPWSRPYMSPEQILWKNKIIGFRSDFFSLWVLAYYLYYWKYPFWNDIEKITEMFNNWEITYELNENCKLKDFFEWVFNTEPHLRPRNTDILLKLLS